MYKKRIAAVAAYLRREKLDAVFVTGFHSILYLTGLKTLSPHEREAYLLLTPDHVFVFTDGRYEEQFRSAKQFDLKVLTAQDTILKQLQDLCKTNGINRLAFEREDLKWSEYDVLSRNVPVELVPVDRLVLRERAVKTEKEVEDIARACAIGDGCLSHIVPLIRPGTTEKRIAWEMEKWVREQGHEFSFEPIVAVDANAAIPHYNTKEGQGTVQKKSVVLIDMGVKYRDYCSDITRMFFVGEPDPAVRAAYLALLAAQTATIEELKFTNELRNADLFCRGKLETDGFPPYPHSTGHGIGLEVHEFPKVSANSEDAKTAGQVFTVEPGIYVPGKWGMRIEDTVAVTVSGIRVLTKFPKTLVVV